MTATATTFISYKKDSQNLAAQKCRSSEPSLSANRAMSTSNIAIRKMASQRVGGDSTVTQNLSSNNNYAAPNPNTATSQNGPVLRRKYAVIGRSFQESVSASETDVTPMLGAINASRAQGNPNNFTPSFSQWKPSEKPIQKEDTRSLHRTTSSAPRSLQPHRCSAACLQADATTSTADSSFPTCGASRCHSSVPPSGSRARALSTPEQPDRYVQPSLYPARVSREELATSSCVNSRPRGRSHTISSTGNTYQLGQSLRALPTPSNRGSTKKDDSLSYAIFHLGSNHRVARVSPAVETKTERIDSPRSHGSGSASVSSSHSRSPRPGPAAGTGHEGYGKFAPNIRRRKSALRRVRSIREQDLSRMGSTSAENRVPTTRDGPASRARAPEVAARTEDQQNNTTKGYCISPTPRLEAASISTQALLGRNKGSAKTTSTAPKKKKRSKLNWAFIKNLCGAGCVRESSWRFNEDVSNVGATDCQSIIILPPPPAKDDSQCFSMSNMRPQVPPKDRHNRGTTDARITRYPASQKSNNFYRGRAASDAAKPLSFSSSASSFADYDSDMTEEELWSEYDDLLDDISHISNSLSYGSPYRLVSGQPSFI